MKALNVTDAIDGIEFSLNSNIPTGKSIKIQPHETHFYKLMDQKQKYMCCCIRKFPKIINAFVRLEDALSKYACVTKGDIILIKSEEKTFYFDILEVSPSSSTNCICVIDIDIEVDIVPLSGNEYLKSSENCFQNDEIDELEEDKSSEALPNINAYNPREHRLPRGLRGQAENIFSQANAGFVVTGEIPKVFVSKSDSKKKYPQIKGSTGVKTKLASSPHNFNTGV